MWQGEPTVAECLAAGADLVTFSGDKLFSGPQAGFLCGREELVKRAAAHPVARAARLDKLALAGLAATLAAWKTGGWRAFPVYRAAGATLSELEERGRRLARAASTGRLAVDIVSSRAAFGGGTSPEKLFESRALALRHPEISADGLGGGPARRDASDRRPARGRHGAAGPAFDRAGRRRLGRGGAAVAQRDPGRALRRGCDNRSMTRQSKIRIDAGGLARSRRRPARRLRPARNGLQEEARIDAAGRDSGFEERMDHASPDGPASATDARPLADGHHPHPDASGVAVAFDRAE